MTADRIGRALLALLALGAVLAAIALLWSRQLDPTSCESRCTSDEKCMEALDAEDIAPMGSTRGDRGLCNGICSTLRKRAREFKKTQAQFGLEGERFEHPCLPRAGP